MQVDEENIVRTGEKLGDCHEGCQITYPGWNKKFSSDDNKKGGHSNEELNRFFYFRFHSREINRKFYSSLGILIADNFSVDFIDNGRGDLVDVDEFYEILARVEKRDPFDLLKFCVDGVQPHQIVHQNLKGVFLGKITAQDFKIDKGVASEVVAVAVDNGAGIAAFESEAGLHNRTAAIQKVDASLNSLSDTAFFNGFEKLPTKVVVVNLSVVLAENFSAEHRNFKSCVSVIYHAKPSEVVDGEPDIFAVNIFSSTQRSTVFVGLS